MRNKSLTSVKKVSLEGDHSLKTGQYKKYSCSYDGNSINMCNDSNFFNSDLNI